MAIEDPGSWCRPASFVDSDAPAIVAFARAVRGEVPYPITGEELINNITILEAAIRSAASDGAVVTL